MEKMPEISDFHGAGGGIIMSISDMNFTSVPDNFCRIEGLSSSAPTRARPPRYLQFGNHIQAEKA
ncbi:MAG: hypothetical protein R3E02_15540 [Blastomonas sp.]